MIIMEENQLGKEEGHGAQERRVQILGCYLWPV